MTSPNTRRLTPAQDDDNGLKPGVEVEITSGMYVEHGTGEIIGTDGRFLLLRSTSTRFARSKNPQPLRVLKEEVRLTAS